MGFVITIIGSMVDGSWNARLVTSLRPEILIFRFVFAGQTRIGLELGMGWNAKYY
jgi:hypothetical protein